MAKELCKLFWNYSDHHCEYCVIEDTSQASLNNDEFPAEFFDSKMEKGREGLKRGISKQLISKKLSELSHLKDISFVICIHHLYSEILDSEDSKALQIEILKDFQNIDFKWMSAMPEYLSLMNDIFTVGTDNSATTVEFAMTEMMRHPIVLAKAQDEPRQVLRVNDRIRETDLVGLSYLKMMIKETLRLHPPLPLALPRKDVESFKPKRFADGYIEFKGQILNISFLWGERRICPGISFGLADVEFLLAQLLYHFDWKLPNEMKLEDVDMTEILGWLFGGKRSCIWFLLLIKSLNITIEALQLSNMTPWVSHNEEAGIHSLIYPILIVKAHMVLNTCYDIFSLFWKVTESQDV
ncbi:costunolide synthase-like [Olea europaea var. sylvestris]|uniref:costunolide synthase-like n=1 Tax=Olea europaea var. sylvestris TaxID=158386 RepID=UPI000C1D4ED4|nr:costunolide synthase-like [Olea europaea var. sylvestris]